jgi:amidohydrolase
MEPTSLINCIKQLAEKYFDENVKIRRHIHKYPELSFTEFNTTEYIISQLEANKIRYSTRKPKTGLTAIIEGKNPSKKLIVLKADIDALPITEKNEVEYKSVNQGVMHACGHDFNTTTLIGASKIMNELKEEFEGTIKLIFQPGEERLPGGAKEIIDEGVLQNPSASIVIAQHGLPELETGKIGFKSGVYMASTDEIYLTVKGKGGHGAIPGNFTDSILIASHIIVALQQIVSRNAPPTTPTVLSFGKIIGNGSTNIIPDEVSIEGTFRTMNEEWRYRAHEKIIKIATEIAVSMDSVCEVKIVRGYPALYNDPNVTETVRIFSTQYIDKENIIELNSRMTSDDFSYFSQVLPSTYFRIGIGNKAKNIVSQLHTSSFNIDEEALKLSTGLMSWIAISLLGN